jgi:phosphoglycolate phosphatase/pyrophosphatase PpaX
MCAFRSKSIGSFKRKLIIWDFDGTVVHSLPATFRAFNAGLKPFLGREFTDQEILGHFGPPDQEIIAKLVGPTHAQEAYDLVLMHMKANMGEIYVFDELLPVINTLSQRGCRHAIFTGRGRVSTELIMTELDLNQHFEMVVTNDDVQNHKPDPEGIFKILEKLGSTPQQAVMVGDSNADVIAGSAAGCFTVGCQWSPHAAHFTQSSKRPDYVAKTPRCILKRELEILL